jgi:hypothetical protein
MTEAVRKPVDLTVEAGWTNSSPLIVHSLAACHPLRDAQGSQLSMFTVSNVMAWGYDSIHSVHRPY